MDDQARKALELARLALENFWLKRPSMQDKLTDASKAISAVDAALAAPAAPVVPADLVEAVDRVLAEAPCECGERLRFDRGEHLSGCYLFDLNEARNRVAAPAAPVAQPLTDEQIARMWMAGYSDASGESMVSLFARAIERAHGIGQKGA